MELNSKKDKNSIDDTQTQERPATAADKSDDIMDNEEFDAETKRYTALGKQALLEHDISKAFHYLFFPAHVNGEALRFFLMIINTYTRLYLLSDDQVALLKDYAEKGYAVSQYAYGRYLYITRPDDNSLEEADKYFKEAEKAGMGDAIQALSNIMLDGHYGEVDLEKAYKQTREAIGKNSELAARIYLRRLVFGNDKTEANPQKAIDLIKLMLGDDESDDISEINPIYYDVLGDAYEKLGDKEKAKHYYEKAIKMGYLEAYGNYCVLFSEGNDSDLPSGYYENMLDLGCSQGDPSSYVYRATMHMDHYDDCDVEEQPQMTQQIKEDLETAIKLGSQIAPYFLGNAYYYGEYGFEQDNTEAWNWYIEGTKRNDGDCYKMVAVMFSEEDAPVEATEDLMAYCAIMAVRINRDEDMLKVVVESYRDGDLTDYADEIEKYYIPAYEALEEEGDNDGDDDDDYDYKLIAIVKTDGSADIMEFDVEEGWDELPDYIGARRLDAIRTQPLYDISKRFRLDGHVTGWVDNMGLMKDLMMNPIGRSLYPGPIAGDMILTMEDEKYNPTSFTSLNVLKKVLAALGATLDKVILDDGPDDDGRYDAWS